MGLGRSLISVAPERHHVPIYRLGRSSFSAQNARYHPLLAPLLLSGIEGSGDMRNNVSLLIDDIDRHDPHAL